MAKKKKKTAKKKVVEKPKKPPPKKRNLMDVLENPVGEDDRKLRLFVSMAGKYRAGMSDDDRAAGEELVKKLNVETPGEYRPARSQAEELLKALDGK